MATEYMTLVEFVSETSEREALVAYTEDPDAAIENANLSPEHKEVLRSQDRSRLQSALKDEASEVFELWAISAWGS
jgi:hypothetical protein